MVPGRGAGSIIRQALSAGYRGFDCAQMYHNEREAGKAIAEYLASSDNTKGLKREDIWYTTKLANNGTSYSAVRRSIKKSVEVSGLGYVDLFLLHSPLGGPEARMTSWKAVEDAIDEGEVRAGGVSNFGSAHVSEHTKIESSVPSLHHPIVPMHDWSLLGKPYNDSRLAD